MVSDRLRSLQENLTDLYEQLGGKEKALIRAPEEEKTRIRQQIRDVKHEIYDFEREYWTRWQTEVKSLALPEAEAEATAAEIVQEVEILSTQAIYPDEGVEILRQILAELRQPETPATGKLKAAIPLLPGLLAYETELDTEGLLRRILPIFRRFVKK